MSSSDERNLINILPKDGPTVEEAINYLEKYNDEFIVIKCGGSVLVDPKLFKIFIKDVAVLNKLGFNPIIIHGGGPRIKIELAKLNIESQFINGLRVTDNQTMKVVEKTLIDFNSEIVEKLKKKNCKSEGVNVNMNNVLIVEQENKELGFVGKPTKVIKEKIQAVMNKNLIPVLSPMGKDEKEQKRRKNSIHQRTRRQKEIISTITRDAMPFWCECFYGRINKQNIVFTRSII